MNRKDVVVVVTILTNGLEKVSNLGPRFGPAVRVGLPRMYPAVDVFKVLRQNVFCSGNLKKFDILLLFLT